MNMRSSSKVLGVVVGLALMAGSAAAARPAKEVKITVTEKGFQPARVEIQAGQPVTLKVTRKTERTCATELVLSEYQIHEKLPLGKTVRIHFTPKSAGELTYACGMDMIRGTLVVKPAGK